jgi:hypothetical protein
MEQFMLVLTPENDSFTGNRTIIVNQPLTIGRQLENQDQQSANFLRFNSKVVSRQHCKVSFADNKVSCLLRFMGAFDVLQPRLVLVLHSRYQVFQWNICQWGAVKPSGAIQSASTD